MKHAWKTIQLVFVMALIVGTIYIAWEYIGPAGAGFVGAILGLLGWGNIADGPKISRDSDPISEAGERNREAGESVKESVRNLNRRADELEATVKRIEDGAGAIGGTAGDLGSLADSIRRGVASAGEKEGTGTKP